MSRFDYLKILVKQLDFFSLQPVPLSETNYSIEALGYNSWVNSIVINSSDQKVALSLLYSQQIVFL